MSGEVRLPALAISPLRWHMAEHLFELDIDRELYLGKNFPSVKWITLQHYCRQLGHDAERRGFMPRLPQMALLVIPPPPTDRRDREACGRVSD
jgi:hypothetical protein